MSNTADRGSVLWSPDVERYACGELPVEQVQCALCQDAPCNCPPFGTAAYFALIDSRHGRTKGGQT
ncbi:hypothetical protein [Nonomuraea endophytica]|uniref:hypothetical protein n=1 Tax=Nonomuraea endophytica TaxID=714136 RepID=UPI0037C80B42